MHPNLTRALEAIGNLTLHDLDGIFNRGQMGALIAYSEIKDAPISRKTGPFYRHLVPLRKDLGMVLANSFRKYFKLALTHPRETGCDPDKWALIHLQPALGVSLEWLREWYILACDGENQWSRPVGSIAFVPGQSVSLTVPTASPPSQSWKSWRAPAWLFTISIALVGFDRIKRKHAPAANSEQRLGAAHTRLILKGARRVFLWELGAAIERARDEELVSAAASAIPADAVSSKTRRQINRKGWQQREKLYDTIQRTLNENPSLQGIEFCAELDRRHARPLYDWTKSRDWRQGLTWKEAWGNPALRRKIRRVRQEAQKRR